MNNRTNKVAKRKKSKKHKYGAHNMSTSDTVLMFGVPLIIMGVFTVGLFRYATGQKILKNRK